MGEPAVQRIAQRAVMTDTPRSSAEADLAFLKSIVEGGSGGSGKAMLTMGAMYLAGGLLYGLQCLFHIGQIYGLIRWPDPATLIFLIGVTGVFLVIMTWAIIQDRKVGGAARGQMVTRTMNAAFSATGMANMAVIIVFGVGAARDDDFATWLYYPAVIFALQSAAWYVAWSLRKKPWMLFVAGGGWLTAVALGVLVRAPVLYLFVCTAALFLLFALPGWIMLSGALKARAAD